MKIKLLLAFIGLSLISTSLNSQTAGFSSVAINYNVPVGGVSTSTLNLGYFTDYYTTTSTAYNGSQNWCVTDMNGDKYPDLVVTAQATLTGQSSSVFDTGSGPFWKIYPGNGTSFANTATNWPVPVGGTISGTLNLGYNMPAYTTFAGAAAGQENWSLLDMDGDSKPDLVVTAKCNTNGNPPEGFGLATAPPTLWKVYLNTGSGFATNYTSWTLPPGGSYNSNGLLGFTSTEYTTLSGAYSGQQNWTLSDVDGDNDPDLVVTAQCTSQSNPPEGFGLGSSPYWKVFLNHGTGFSVLATNWSVPNGGSYTASGNIGYSYASYVTTSGAFNNQENWNLTDIDGDKKPDLIVTAQALTNGSTPLGFGAASSNPYWKVFLNTGTGFAATNNNWGIPVGGAYTSSANIGYIATSFFNNTGAYPGQQNWDLVDLNADGKKDLVITAQTINSGDAPTGFNPYTNSHWKVFFNNGSSFNTSAINWSLPFGGQFLNSGSAGYINTAYSNYTGTYLGSQNWTINDMNNDGSLDLVVMAESSANGSYPATYSATTTPFWKVYINQGVVGIKENNLAKETIIYTYPNPFTDKITVSTTGKNTISHLEIYTITGQLIRKEKLDNPTTEINLKELQSGIYFLKAGNGTAKIIKE